MKKALLTFTLLNDIRGKVVRYVAVVVVDVRVEQEVIAGRVDDVKIGDVEIGVERSLSVELVKDVQICNELSSRPIRSQIVLQAQKREGSVRWSHCFQNRNIGI